GNMWKPFDFDPKKKYPIIANVYPGPQTEGVTHRFAAYSSTMQLAQLGFVVIQVGHRGGSPERSKAYHSFGYCNLRDYGLGDKKDAGVAATGSGASTTSTTGGENRRRPPEEEAVEAEIELLLTSFDPDDEQSVADVEKKLAELQKRLAELKKASAETSKTEKAAASVEQKAPPKMKWEIKVPTN